MQRHDQHVLSVARQIVQNRPPSSPSFAMFLRSSKFSVSIFVQLEPRRDAHIVQHLAYYAQSDLRSAFGRKVRKLRFINFICANLLI